MIITIELQSSEELAWLQPLIEQLQLRDVAMNIQMGPLPISGNYNPQALRMAVQQAQAKHVFRRIEDPVSWQKKLRDEWE